MRCDNTALLMTDLPSPKPICGAAGVSHVADCDFISHWHMLLRGEERWWRAAQGRMLVKADRLLSGRLGDFSLTFLNLTQGASQDKPQSYGSGQGIRALSPRANAITALHRQIPQPELWQSIRKCLVNGEGFRPALMVWILTCTHPWKGSNTNVSRGKKHRSKYRLLCSWRNL